MKREHQMPFGAECLPDDGVRFRLWAPEPARVDVCVDGSILPMEQRESNWFELSTNRASLPRSNREPATSRAMRRRISNSMSSGVSSAGNVPRWRSDSHGPLSAAVCVVSAEAAEATRSVPWLASAPPVIVTPERIRGSPNG